MLILQYIFFCVTILLVCGCSRDTSEVNGFPSIETIVKPEPLQYGFEIVKKFYHDPEAFTQGLIYVDGFLYEGTGLNGHSSLRKVELATGKVVQRYDLDSLFFGEGITVFGNRLFQITWQKGTAFVYDLASFELLTEFSYTTEGWGLTNDGHQLIMSDGTELLYFIDPHTFKEVGQLSVFDGDRPVRNLNELEYVDGEIWANVWRSERIARIDLKTGHVVGWINLTGLLSEEDRDGRLVDVLNGIAYDPIDKRIFVTGKWWPILYQINVREL